MLNEFRVNPPENMKRFSIFRGLKGKIGKKWATENKMRTQLTSDFEQIQFTNPEF